MIGKADYQDYLVIIRIASGVCDNNYPVFVGVVLPRCILGTRDNVFANSSIVNEDIPSQTIVLGNHPNVRFKKTQFR